MSEDDNPYLADPPKHRDPEWLYEQYWERGRSGVDIAESLGISQQTLYKSMRSVGVRVRSSAEANNLRHRKRLFGDDEEEVDD